MRYVLLLCSLLICSTISAKKKDHITSTKTKNYSVESVDNKILTPPSGLEFNEPNSTLNTPYLQTPIAAILYDEGSNLTSDSFLENSDISYKNVSNTEAESTSILEINSSTQNNASIDSNSTFRQGMYYGFTLMLILLNLVCFFLFDEKAFLYYSMALASMTLLLFYSDGLYSFLDIQMLGNSLSMQALFLLVACSLSAVFLSKFLSLNEYLPKLKYLTLSILGIASLSLTFGAITANPEMVKFSNTLLFGILGTYFVAGVILFNKKNYAKFFVIASFIPLLFILDYFVLSPLGIDFLATQTIHIKAATIAEMLIMTYAIMYRMQSIKEESALRQAELRIFLRRQEALTSRKKTERIVEDVYLENLIMHYDLDGLEIKLLQYISEGKENPKIARKLKTTENEIEEMTKELYLKLEISEQIQQDYRMVDAQPDYIYN